jgi:hypothetical protein
MKPAPAPRFFAIVLIVLLVLVFLAGAALAFRGVSAATLVRLAPTPTSVPVEAPSLTPVPEIALNSADTTGILALGILLVAVILIGLLRGGRLMRK